jgi:hypothetical protein
MAFTDADLTNVDAALVALARGQRKVRLTMGDKSIEYSDINIDKLKAFRNEIAAELSVTPRFFMISTSKGL